MLANQICTRTLLVLKLYKQKYSLLLLTDSVSEKNHGSQKLTILHLFQQWPMATLHLSFLSPSSAPALPSLEMSPAILVASSTSKMESMPLHLSPSEPACLVPNCPSSCSTMLLYLLYSGIFVLVHCDFHPTKLTVPKSTWSYESNGDQEYLNSRSIWLICIHFQGIAKGYATFVISITGIGICTAVIGDVAGHLGCFINLKDGVNAIAFVALGTSVPGTTIHWKTFDVGFRKRQFVNVGIRATILVKLGLGDHYPSALIEVNPLLWKTRSLWFKISNQLYLDSDH